MKEAVATNPLNLGYGFSTWSAARLAAHLAKVTGMHFSSDQMRRLLHRESYFGSSSQAHHEGEHNEAAYSTAKKQLRRLLKKSPEEGRLGISCLPRRSGDSSASLSVADVGAGGDTAGGTGTRPK